MILLSLKVTLRKHTVIKLLDANKVISLVLKNCKSCVYTHGNNHLHYTNNQKPHKHSHTKLHFWKKNFYLLLRIWTQNNNVWKAKFWRHAALHLHMLLANWLDKNSLTYNLHCTYLGCPNTILKKHGFIQGHQPTLSGCCTGPWLYHRSTL